MSLSEHDRQVLAELEHDLGSPSVATRLYLLKRAAQTTWCGLLLPAIAFAVGAGLIAAGLLVSVAPGEIMVVAGIAAASYAAYAATLAYPAQRRAQKKTMT